MRPKKDLLDTKPRVINLGLEIFADDLESHGVPVARVDWRPPAGGDLKMMALFEKLRERPVDSKED